MPFAPTEMVGDDRVDQRDRSSYEPAHPEAAQHQMGDEGSQRKAREVVQIDTEDRIVGELHQHPQSSEMQMVPALRVVVCLKPARPPQMQRMQIRAPAAQHSRLYKIEEGIAGVAEGNRGAAEAKAETEPAHYDGGGGGNARLDDPRPGPAGAPLAGARARRPPTA